MSNIITMDENLPNIMDLMYGDGDIDSIVERVRLSLQIDVENLKSTRLEFNLTNFRRIINLALIRQTRNPHPVTMYRQ